MRPNIPFCDQTLEQLRAERAHWDHKINEATGWGAAYKAQMDFRDACDAWIAKREREAASAPQQP